MSASDRSKGKSSEQLRWSFLDGEAGGAGLRGYLSVRHVNVFLASRCARHCCGIVPGQSLRPSTLARSHRMISQGN
jgi:hypothetical protein